MQDETLREFFVVTKGDLSMVFSEKTTAGDFVYVYEDALTAKLHAASHGFAGAIAIRLGLKELNEFLFIDTKSIAGVAAIDDNGKRSFLRVVDLGEDKVGLGMMNEVFD